MNLVNEDVKSKKEKDSKKAAKIILFFMLVLILAIIGIFATMIYVQSKEFKFFLNGNLSEKIEEMMVTEEDGTIYFPIKDISSYLGYESYNGEYANKSEDQSKCYIECEDEVANFSLNSNKIYTLMLDKNNQNYDYFYASKPIIAKNGKLYATSDAIEKAFNVSFTYDKQKNKAYIYTLPYLIQAYSARTLDSGYEKISEEFVNEKALLNGMIVAEKNRTFGVIDTNGETILEPKYDHIEYLPYTGDFLVKSNGKVGIISKSRETKVQLLYDDLELIDGDAALYLAKKDGKYGVIDFKGNTKIYIEYDEIGIDISKFKENEIKNKYLLDNGMLPVRKDKLWGAFDKNGNQILNFEYDSFGYINSNNREAINLLVIPDYDVMVAAKDKRYTLISVSGEELCYPVLTDVYMMITSGKKYYYMIFNDQTADVIEFLKQRGVKVRGDSSTDTTNKKKNNKDDEEEQEENTKQNTINETSTNSSINNDQSTTNNNSNMDNQIKENEELEIIEQTEETENVRQ